MKGFKVKVEHDMFSRKPIFITFKIMLICETMGTLYEHSFQHESFKSGMNVVEEMKEFLLQPTVLLKLTTKHLSEEMGFEIDASRGLKGFAADVAERFSTDMLKENIEKFKDDWIRPAMENELEKRGKIQNDKLNFVGSSK